MYGSSFTRETLILRDSRIAAREAAAIPFPSEETTPPVTKTYLVMCKPCTGRFEFYRKGIGSGESPYTLRMKVGGKHYRSLWADESQRVVHIIDQTRLPHVFETRTLATSEAVAEAIRGMRVRGAPLIGVAAAFGVPMAVAPGPSHPSI